MTHGINSLLDRARKVRDELARAPAAKNEARRDRRTTQPRDHGIAAVAEAALDWLGAAEDHSTSRDGDVARHYSLLSGWSASYPETNWACKFFIDANLLEQEIRSSLGAVGV